LTDYEKSVLEVLKNGPKPRKDLFEEICPKTMSEKKLQTTLNELEDEERIICRPIRTGKSRKWTSVYALPKHRHLLEVDYRKVARAVENLRLELCRNPEVEEVAATIGEDPESIQKILFEHAPELKWMPPTPSEKKEAEKSREIARNVASLVKYSLEKDYSLEDREIFWRDDIPESKISVEVFERARFLLEHRFESVREENIPRMGALIIGRTYVGPSEPKERNKKEAIETIRKFMMQKLRD